MTKAEIAALAAEGVEEVITLINAGMSVRKACLASGKVSRETFFQHLSRSKALQSKYDTAKRHGILALIDANEDDLDGLNAELRERVTKTTEKGHVVETPKYDGKLASAMVSAAKLRIEERRFQAMKLLPKLYGIAADLPSNGTVSFTMNLGEPQAPQTADG